MQYEVVTAEAPLGEGPVWCPDGTLVITQISPGGLRRIDPTSGKSETFVSFLGGGNSAQLASDGGFVVCNNGCIDFTLFADALGLDATKIPYTPGPPGLQRVFPDGDVITLAHEGLQAPNDLIVAADGTVYFGSWDGKIYAVKGSSKGSAKGWWSQFRQGPSRSGVMDASANQSLYRFVGD